MLTTIEIKNGSIFINDSKIDTNTTLERYKKILGEPSRIKIATAEEIKDAIKKFGASSGNFYTYDDLGIYLSQDPQTKKIQDIEVVFVNENYSYAPHKIFTGKVKINSFEIDKSTSLKYLKAISDLKIVETLYQGQPAKIYNYDVFFYFSEFTLKNVLNTFSISMVSRKIHSNGWSSEDFGTMKASILNNIDAQKMTKENNIDIEKLGDCYAKKIMQTFKQSQFQNPKQTTLDSIQAVVNDCILEVSQKYKFKNYVTRFRSVLGRNCSWSNYSSNVIC